MRISDWSSDVCSSDLSSFGGKLMCDCPTRSSRYVSEVFLIGDRRHLVNNAVNVVFKRRTQELDLFEMGYKSFERIECSQTLVCNEAQTAQLDRHSVVSGKSVCVCLSLVGRLIFNKN